MKQIIIDKGIIDSTENPFTHDSWIEQKYGFTSKRQGQLKTLLGQSIEKILSAKPENDNRYVAFVAIRWGFATITHNFLLPTYKWNHRQHFDDFGQPLPPFEISEFQANKENLFNEKIFEVYNSAKELCDYNAIRFLQKIRHDGGITAAKAWLNPKNIEKPPTGGFLKLMSNGRLDISLEALVLKNDWIDFFSDEEIMVAKTRLLNYGYKDSDLHNEYSDQLIPEEITNSEIFPEGTKHKIYVNAYERNHKARERCIEHFGSTCTVCGFNFEKIYGPNFKSFIHVHHLRPLSTISDSYNLNPIEDLRPICPNCHAIIHKQNPPFTIAEMKRIIKGRK